MTVAEPAVRILGMAHHSRVDGPGKRFVVYFSGCPLRCTWCHSPHSWPEVSPLLFFESRCVLCGRCANACENGVHRVFGGTHQVDRRRCTRCGKCVAACPQSTPGKGGSALQLPTQEWHVQALYAHVAPYLRLCDGITLSGGEALAQRQGAAALLARLKENGVHTAVETSGLLPPEVYQRVLPLVDVWLIGIRVVTGAGCETDTTRLIENGRLFLRGAPGAVRPRVPMVPGVMDAPNVLARIDKVLAALGLRQLTLSPWNRDYLHYYTASGTVPRYGEPTPNEMAQTEAKMTAFFRKKGYMLMP